MNRDILIRLYEMYRRELYLYLYGICHNRSLAEDLTQETFLKAIVSLPDDHANMRAWLYKVGHNLCISYLRKAAKEVPTEDPAVLQGAMTDTGPDTESGNTGPLSEFSASSAPIDSDSVADELLTKERNRTLYKCILQLPEQNREVLILQYFGECSQREIAEILHTSPGNVRVLAHRGRARLKELLIDAGYESM